jgi:hypothetical protein
MRRGVEGEGEGEGRRGGCFPPRGGGGIGIELALALTLALWQEGVGETVRSVWGGGRVRGDDLLSRVESVRRGCCDWVWRWVACGRVG